MSDFWPEVKTGVANAWQSLVGLWDKGNLWTRRVVLLLTAAPFIVGLVHLWTRSVNASIISTALLMIAPVVVLLRQPLWLVSPEIVKAVSSGVGHVPLLGWVAPLGGDLEELGRKLRHALRTALGWSLLGCVLATIIPVENDPLLVLFALILLAVGLLLPKTKFLVSVGVIIIIGIVLLGGRSQLENTAEAHAAPRAARQPRPAATSPRVLGDAVSGYTFPGHTFTVPDSRRAESPLPIGLGLYRLPPGTTSPCLTMQSDRNIHCMGFGVERGSLVPQFWVNCRNGAQGILLTNENRNMGMNSVRIVNNTRSEVRVWTHTEERCG